MFCKNCGNQLDVNVKFCDKCGTQVVIEPSAQSTPSVANIPASTPVPPDQNSEPTSQQPALEFDRFRVIFKAAWSNYKSKFWKLILFQLLAYIPLLIVIATIVLAATIGSKAGMNSTPVIILGLIAGLILLILVIYWLVWVQAASIQYLFDQPALSIKETFKTVKPKLKNYFFATLLSGGLILLGFMLLIIPGIFISLMLLFTPFIAIAENKGAIESIKTSREYARGRLSAIFTRNFFFGLVYIGIFIIPVIADVIIGSVLDLENFQILENVISFVLAPLTTAFIIAMYQSLKKVQGQVVIGEIKGTRWYLVLGIIGATIIPIMLLGSVALLALGSARAKSRDAKRVADVRFIASSLELYRAQTGRYPVNLSALTPQYLGEVPVAPTPQDGECSEIDNGYRYSYLSADQYALTFCLGFETGNISAGKHSLTQNGIDVKK